MEYSPYYQYHNSPFSLLYDIPRVCICACDTVCFAPRSSLPGTPIRPMTVPLWDRKGEKSHVISGEKARRSVGHGGRVGASSRPCREGEQPRYPGNADAGLGLRHAGMHGTHTWVYPAFREEGISHGTCPILVPIRSESQSGSLRSDNGGQWAAISPSRMT